MTLRLMHRYTPNHMATSQIYWLTQLHILGGRPLAQSRWHKELGGRRPLAQNRRSLASVICALCLRLLLRLRRHSHNQRSNSRRSNSNRSKSSSSHFVLLGHWWPSNTIYRVRAVTESSHFVLLGHWWPSSTIYRVRSVLLAHQWASSTLLRVSVVSESNSNSNDTAGTNIEMLAQQHNLSCVRC